MAVDYVPAKVPVVGQVISVILQMSTFGVLCFCLTRRTQHIRKWSRLPLAQWLILIIYADSALFVFATSLIVQGFGINSSREVCEGGILLCLVCYMTTKILIYYFLVERAYIVGGSMRPRLKTKLWLFNCLFMLLPYTIFVIMNFIFRITYINPQGVCIIGMQKIAMLPLITFEVVVNVYLTLLFIIPIRRLHSYKSNTNPALNRMAFRSFVGSCATLITSVVNLTVLMVLKGEPGWICLMVCNADILFCVLVLHWVSKKERKDEDSAFRSRTQDGHAANAGNAPIGVGTVGSNRSRSRRVSFETECIMDDERAAKAREAETNKSVEMSIKPLESVHVHVHENALAHQPSDASLHSLQTALRMPATITTECSAEPVPSGIISVFHRRGSSWDGDVQPGIREDEVELNKIRVETIQTREVEGKRSQSENSLDDGCEWVESRKGVVGEGMV